MFDNVLYITGNGFELHHGVPSSYNCFRDWLSEHDYMLYCVYSDVCRYDALWSDFENGMAYVDRDYFIGMGELFLPDYSRDPDDWQMADILMAGDTAREHAEELVRDLKSAFHKWIKSLRVPKSYSNKKLFLDYNARFLTFNYTEFLESEYGITRDNIKYIHGHRLGGKDSIVVGHGGDDEAFDKWWNSKQYNKPRYNKKGKRYNFRDTAYKVYRSILPEYEGIAEGVQDYYEDSRKPVERILRDNAEYFDDLYDIETIYVWGFSFNPIDLPYIQKIMDSNDYPAQIRWHVSYYAESGIARIRTTMAELGIDVDNQVDFRPMSSWQIKN